jgi:hypothetical protein
MNMLKTTTVFITILSISTPVFAQATTKTLPPRPAYSAALPNTLSMTCGEARNLILSKPEGFTMRTGANRWDHYHHDAEYCRTGSNNLVPQFVETKDNGTCHVGFTCLSVAE